MMRVRYNDLEEAFFGGNPRGSKNFDQTYCIEINVLEPVFF